MRNDREKIAQGKTKKKLKALTTSEPTTLGPFEVFGKIGKLIKDKEKELLLMIRRELRGSTINKIKLKDRKEAEVKALSDILRRLDEFFSLESLGVFITEVIKSAFTEGNEKAEKNLDMNLPENPSQTGFLSNMALDLIKDLSDETKADLRGVLQRAIAQGQSIGKIADDVKNVMNISKARAETIARTETARATQLGELQAMKSSGVDARKYILIVRDERTTEVSKAMEAKYGTIEQSIPLDGVFSVVVNGKTFEGQAPPFMPNDRDSVIYITQEEFEEEKNGEE